MEKKKSTSKGKVSSVSQIFNHFIDNESIIKKFLRRFSSNPHDIDDICQETILRALNAEKNRDIHEPRAFLFGVAKNVARKALDKKSKSFANFKILIALSAFAGPVPEPVLPIFSFNSPLESLVR